MNKMSVGWVDVKLSHHVVLILLTTLSANALSPILSILPLNI